MKNIILLFGFMLTVSLGFSQIKVEASGDVGIGGISNPLEALDVNGKLKVRGTSLEIGKDAGSNGVTCKVGGSRTANGAAFIDLVSDVGNYPNYGFRFTRTGNGATQAISR